MIRWFELVLLFIIFLVPARAAHSDVPPPPPRDPCNLDDVPKVGQECLLCSLSSPRFSSACRTKYQPFGYTKACQTFGHGEIWCRPAKAKPAPTAVPTVSIATVPPPSTSGSAAKPESSSPELIGSPSANSSGRETPPQTAPATTSSEPVNPPPPASKSGACGACTLRGATVPRAVVFLLLACGALLLRVGRCPLVRPRRRG